MAPATVDAALIAVAAAAKEQEKAAKVERARAMDSILDLLFERAEMRELLAEAADAVWSTHSDEKQAYLRRVERALGAR